MKKPKSITPILRAALKTNSLWPLPPAILEKTKLILQDDLDQFIEKKNAEIAEFTAKKEKEISDFAAKKEGELDDFVSNKVPKAVAKAFSDSSSAPAVQTPKSVTQQPAKVAGKA